MIQTSTKIRFVFTNTSGYATLTAAEAAIVALEAALIPGVKNVGVLSAFGNSEGNTITLKLSSVLDVTYSMQANKFQVIINAAPIPVTHADMEVFCFAQS
ncbi:hypothetical protein [Paenibacillus periandrae]|uniref:hypothetical protein n=1 Tax=Paenibacillus periandrae TaxID=1761741 RepID=UPI001F0945A7|nr:hypothetical protein [Paenibacillus periandrae]